MYCYYIFLNYDQCVRIIYLIMHIFKMIKCKIPKKLVMFNT